MNPVGACILLLLALVVLCGPRRCALLAMMAGVLYLTQGQQLQVLGFHVFAARFLELAGFIRVIARREFSFSQFGAVGKMLLVLYAYGTVIFLLRSAEGQAYVISPYTRASFKSRFCWDYSTRDLNLLPPEASERHVRSDDDVPRSATPAFPRARRGTRAAHRA
jgi:hypothetical protein